MWVFVECVCWQYEFVHQVFYVVWVYCGVVVVCGTVTQYIFDGHFGVEHGVWVLCYDSDMFVALCCVCFFSPYGDCSFGGCF